MNPLLAPITEVFTGLIGLGKELIVDKDKQIEYAFKIAEMQHSLVEKIMTMQTTPKVDAFIKILYAIKEVGIPLLRPLGSAAMTAFGAYAHAKGLHIDPVSQTLLDGAFPGWMTSRHLEKKNASKNRESFNASGTPTWPPRQP